MRFEIWDIPYRSVSETNQTTRRITGNRLQSSGTFCAICGFYANCTVAYQSHSCVILSKQSAPKDLYVIS